MQKTTQYTNGVMAVTALARKINAEIGSYQEHYINEYFGFSVRLSNGAINMSMEIAQDYEAQPSSVTPDKIANVTKTFSKI
jgi:hypothetical protein